MGKEKLIVWLSLLVGISFVMSAWAENVTTAIINVPVANMYKQPDEDSMVISQAIYDSQVDIVNQEGKGWLLIKTDDGYQGWVPTSSVVFGKFKPTEHTVKVTSLFANVYREADDSLHQPVIMAPFDTRFPLIQTYDIKWQEVQLADGSFGWIKSGDVVLDPKPLTMQQMLKQSYRFVGLPYRWAGTSTYGFDCTGFVQMLYRQIGIILPRDTDLMVNWYGFTKVEKQNLQPGDVMFLGHDGKITHSAIYLGDGKIIHDTAYQSPSVKVSDFNDEYWQEMYMTARRLLPQPEFKSSVTPIPAEVKELMLKYTWHKGCPIAIDDLAYVQLSYWGFDDKTHQGALIVNKYLANDVVSIFNELYSRHFPIEKMQPIEYYQGKDDASMAADNTSAFVCRVQTDFPDLYSIHSYGGAIDVNPLINPYVNGDKVDPPESKQYLDPKVQHKGKITENSDIVAIFAKYGWIWGGSWPGQIHDYQHFEKPMNQKD